MKKISVAAIFLAIGLGAMLCAAPKPVSISGSQVWTNDGTFAKLLGVGTNDLKIRLGDGSISSGAGTEYWMNGFGLNSLVVGSFVQSNGPPTWGSQYGVVYDIDASEEGIFIYDVGKLPGAGLRTGMSIDAWGKFNNTTLLLESINGDDITNTAACYMRLEVPGYPAVTVSSGDPDQLSGKAPGFSIGNVFLADTNGLVTASGLIDSSGTPGQLVAYQGGNRLGPTNTIPLAWFPGQTTNIAVLVGDKTAPTTNLLYFSHGILTNNWPGYNGQ